MPASQGTTHEPPGSIDSPVVPDQSLKVRDIIDRFLKGLPLPNLHRSNPVWTDQETLSHDTPDLNRMANLDPMDKLDLARSAKVRKKKAPEEPPGPPEPPKKEPPTE